MAVVGIPDFKWGEKVAAFIVLKENSGLTVDELRQHCSSKLGNYKIPKEIIFLKELPKTHVGKIDKKELKKINIKSFDQNKALVRIVYFQKEMGFFYRFILPSRK